MSPRKLFTLFAFAEVVTWTLLLLGMFLKYVTQTTELGVRVFGLVHGFVFLTYVVVTIVVGVNQRWNRRTTLLGVLAAVPPYATIPFERHVKRHGLLEGGWQARDGAAPRTAPERMVAWAVSNPAVAAGTALVAVALVTGVLVWLGPPIPQS